MKLSEWARRNGVSYKTAWLWFKKGVLPVPARQLPTGTILVDMPNREERGAVLYARVSSADQKADLDRQVARLAAFAAEQGIRVAKVVAEVGSGLDGHRKGLLGVLRSPEYGAIVVEHRDRLARFGSEAIEAALAASGRRLIVMEPDERKDDLMQDMIDVLTSFCARLYGRRSARHRAEKAVAAACES
ncbi:MAG: IS607 family transposase [Firmicutes bacterium]|nr:IS607 family transposase [Bacillota bacterium]